MTVSAFVDLAFLATLVAASIRIATPILFAALGEAVSESAGVLNVGIEGMMVLGAVTGFLVSYAADDQWLGFAAALMAGALAGLLFGYVTIECGADQVLTGIVLNIFCFGMASLVFKALFTTSGELPEIKTMAAWRIPWLSNLEFFGRAFFSQTPVVYIAFGLVPLFWFLLFRTQWGLKVRSTGENPAAAESAGVNVWALRLMVTMIGGAMAGVAGATLAIAQLGGPLPADDRSHCHLRRQGCLSRGNESSLSPPSRTAARLRRNNCGTLGVCNANPRIQRSALRRMTEFYQKGALQ